VNRSWNKDRCGERSLPSIPTLGPYPRSLPPVPALILLPRARPSRRHARGSGLHPGRSDKLCYHDSHWKTRARGAFWSFDCDAAVKRFGYWRDPLAVGSVALYAVNVWWVKPQVHGGFWHGQFNDLLLIPAALPLVLWVQRWMGWRTHDRAPMWSEIFLHLVVWTLVCEGIGPRFIAHATADGWDVLAYTAGAVVAGGWWQWRGTATRVAAAP